MHLAWQNVYNFLKTVCITDFTLSDPLGENQESLVLMVSEKVNTNMVEYWKSASYVDK